MAYARWRDPDGVVHWITTQHNTRVLTACLSLVEVLPWMGAKSVYTGTRQHPTCLLCVVEADEDVYRDVY